MAVYVLAIMEIAVIVAVAAAARRIRKINNSMRAHERILIKLCDRIDACRREVASGISTLKHAQDAGFDALSDIIAQNQAEEPEFKMSDAKMQEGISNLMNYDPRNRKQGG